MDDLAAETVSAQPTRKLTKNQKKKLKDEMPEIREIVTKTPHSRQVNDADDGSIEWMEHTEIKFKPGTGRAKKIDSKPQLTTISQVLHHSYPIGDRYVVFGGLQDKPIRFSELKTMETPLQKEHIDKIAFKALVEAAEKLGYDGEGVIADRLEHGSFNNYAKPLMAYVSQRLIQNRSTMKKSLSSAVEHAFQLIDMQAGSAPRTTELLKDMKYIYPWSKEDGFKVSSPYENPVIIPAVHAAFFASVPNHGAGLINGHLFKSSVAAFASEFEIPSAMLALTMTAVEAVISDHNLKLQTAVDFGPRNAPVYREHMIRIADFCQQKPKRYHHVMHNIFKAVTAGHNLQNLPATDEQDGTGINWEDVPDE